MASGLGFAGLLVAAVEGSVSAVRRGRRGRVALLGMSGLVSLCGYSVRERAQGRGAGFLDRLRDSRAAAGSVVSSVPV